MPKVKINEIPDEERLIFLKKIKKQDFEEFFDEYYDELEKMAVKKGYVNNELKFINDDKYVNAYVLITLKI
jgi:hypothetical protein